MKAANPGSFRASIRNWSRRYQARLLALSIFSVGLLFFGYLFTSTIKLLPIELSILVHVGALILIGFIVLSVVSKGVVPVVICVLGVVLIHNAVTFPLYAEPEKVEVNLGGQIVVWTLYTDQAVKVAGAMHFFLGACMLVFSNILAYRPSILYTRNRPPSADEEWSRYPLWKDNSILADGRSEQVVPLKSMMNEQDRHLIWRYEYVLAIIHGSLNLVRPDGMVPRDSTEILRDRSSGLIMGKARYTGFL